MLRYISPKIAHLSPPPSKCQLPWVSMDDVCMQSNGPKNVSCCSSCVVSAKDRRKDPVLQNAGCPRIKKTSPPPSSSTYPETKPLLPSLRRRKLREKRASWKRKFLKLALSDVHFCRRRDRLETLYSSTNIIELLYRVYGIITRCQSCTWIGVFWWKNRFPARWELIMWEHRCVL